MLGALVGDLIGSPYERNNLKTKTFKLFKKNCRFTDDSVLTIAVAEALLTDHNYEKAFHKYYELFPNAGYGKGFRNWAANGSFDMLDSYGNGAAMRISPLGWFFNDMKQLDLEVERATYFTHHNEEAFRGAKAIAGSIFKLRHGANKNDIMAYVLNLGYDLNLTNKQLKSEFHFASCQATIPLAIKSFLFTNSFEESIRRAISFGGDSDTIASMTCALSEAYYGIPFHIKIKTLEYLQNPQYSELGENFCKFYNQYVAKNSDNIEFFINYKKELEIEDSIWDIFR